MSVALDVLGELARTPMTREILERTRVGKCINEVRKAPACDKQFAKRCRSLINAWQSLLAAPHGEAVVAESWLRQQDAATSADEPRKPKRAKQGDAATDTNGSSKAGSGAVNGIPNAAIIGHSPNGEQRVIIPNGTVGNGASVNGSLSSVQRHIGAPLSNGESRSPSTANIATDRRPVGGPTYVASAPRVDQDSNIWAVESKTSSATPSPAAVGTKPPRAKSTVELLAELCETNSEVKRIVDASQTAKLVLNNKIAIERCDEPEQRSTPASPGARSQDAEKASRRNKKMTKTQSAISMVERESTVPSPSLPKLCIKLSKPGAADSDTQSGLQSVFRFDHQSPSDTVVSTTSPADSPLPPSAKPRKYPDVEDDDDVIDLTFERRCSEDDNSLQQCPSVEVAPGSVSKSKRDRKRHKSAKSGSQQKVVANSSTDQAHQAALRVGRQSGEEPLLHRALKNATIHARRPERDTNQYDVKRDEAKRLGALDLDAIDWHSLDYSLETLYADSPLVTRRYALGVLQPSDVYQPPIEPDGDTGANGVVSHNQPVSSAAGSTAWSHSSARHRELSENGMDLDDAESPEANSNDNAIRPKTHITGGCTTESWPCGPSSPPPLSESEVNLAVASEWTAVNGTRDATACWRPWTAAYTMPSHSVTNASANANSSTTDDAVVIVMPYVVLDRFVL